MKPEELRLKMQALELQEVRLRNVVHLLLLVVASALAPSIFLLDSRYLLPLCLVCVIAGYLFSSHALTRRREIFKARKELASQMGVENLSFVDPLTGFLDHRYLNQDVCREIGWAERLEVNLTLLMVDVDGFRLLNSRLGAAAGDRVLSALAEMMKGSCRGTDTFIRYGGDEFVVLMLGATKPKAQIAVERLQGLVDHWNDENPVPDYRLAFSWGLAAYQQGTNMADLLQAAYQDLCQNKAQPRTDA
jgi:diguanylate cyclase (GGDEF)-like protein